MQINAVNVYSWQIFSMESLAEKFLACWTLRWSLRIGVSVAIVLAGLLPAVSVHAEQYSSAPAQESAAADLASSRDGVVKHREADATCGQGIGCSAFTAAEEQVLLPVSLDEAIERADGAELVTRDMPPPLPPPKIITLL